MSERIFYSKEASERSPSLALTLKKAPTITSPSYKQILIRSSILDSASSSFGSEAAILNKSKLLTWIFCNYSARRALEIAHSSNS